MIADYFVITSARNPRHAQALASEIDHVMKRSGRLRRNIAGADGESRWVLLDFDDVIVHVFLEDSRGFYALEELWGDVERVPFTPRDGVPASAATRAAPRPAPRPTTPHDPLFPDGDRPIEPGG